MFRKILKDVKDLFPYLVIGGLLGFIMFQAKLDNKVNAMPMPTQIQEENNGTMKQVPTPVRPQIVITEENLLDFCQEM